MGIVIEVAKPVQKKIKLLVYGPSGSGKTHAALTFPRSLLVDSESGSDFFAGKPGIPEFHRARAKTISDLEDVINQVRADAGKTWDTLVIDPISVFYNVQKTAASSNNSKDLTYRDWAKINNRMNSLYTKLIELPVHIIVIAREAVEYEGEGASLRRVGLKPDADKSLVYNMDFVVRLQDNRSPVIEKARGSGLGDRLATISWADFEPVANLYVKGEKLALESDEEAALRETDNLQNDEVAKEFSEYWKAKGLTNADLLAAMGVKARGEWTQGRKAADDVVQAYVDKQKQTPPAAPRGKPQPEGAAASH